MTSRRQFLSGLKAFGGIGALSSLTSSGISQAADYKALVVIFLDGGNDHNNTLIPTDGAYADYAQARTDVLTLPKESLLKLSGTSANHSFGVHPGMGEVRRLYESKRLAFLSNVGALVEPVNRELLFANKVRLPVGLGSHNDQAGFVQGATEDSTGWGGRGLEALNPSLRHPIAAVAASNLRTLVQGRNTSVSTLADWADFGIADLYLNPQQHTAQRLFRLSKLQSQNIYEQSYLNTLRQAMADRIAFGKAAQFAKGSSYDFGSSGFAQNLRTLARMLPGFREIGLRRQVFLMNFGGFDHHTRQRGSYEGSHDDLLTKVSKAIGAFDSSNRDNGIDGQVLTIVASEFGRTLRPGSGQGTEHGWASVWMAFGSMVDGGKVHGYFPIPIAGGQDDSDKNSSGRFIPSTSSDQVAATAMLWLGLAPDRLTDVFPFLVNFPRPTMDYLSA